MRVAVVHNRDTTGVINVFGPQNREKYNPRTVERVARALERGGHNVRVIDGNMDVVEELEEFMPRVIAGERPGMVFNMAYGIQGVSRYTHLPAILEMLGVPYVGSNPLAHGLALDKVIAKIVFKNAGLPTPGFWSFASADDQFDDLTFPSIVKPKMEAVSYGLRVVHNEEELREAVAEIIQEFQQNVLVEQFVAGREFAIGLLGNGDPEVLPIVEIDLEGDPNAIQSAEDKLRAPRNKLCPAPLSDQQTAELQALAKRAFHSLELFDFARVDLRMDDKGNPYILEINSMASLGLTGTYVHAAMVAGYSYEQMINRMLDVAAIRYFGQDFLAGDGATDGGTPEGTTARVRHHVRSQEQTLVESLRRMVDVRTPPDEVEHVNELGEWLTGQLRELGFTADVYSQVGVGNALYFRNHTEERDDVLLLAHLDTAPTETYVPFREEANRLFGTGVAESKGGIVVALGALRALRFARTLRRIKCGFLLTTDDTRAGGRPLVEELAPKSRFVIGLKAGDLEGGAVVSRAGLATYRLEAVRRRSATPPAPADVVSHLFRRLLALQGLGDDEELRVGVTDVALHAAPGSTPEVARAQVTALFNDAASAEAIDGKIRELAEKRTTRGVRLRATGGVRRPPMERNEASDVLYGFVERVARRLNQRMAAVHRWQPADISLAPAAVPRIDGLGPLGGAERTDDEYVFRNSLVDRAALLALVMRECARSES